MHDTSTTERWLPVVGWEGLYEVSDLGRVRSLPRRVPRRHTGYYDVRGGFLTLHRHRRGGYLLAALTVDDMTTKQMVHRLVLEAFVGPCPDGQECRHMDGDPTNNTVGNLRWGTTAENADDRVRHGRYRGEANHATKLSAADVERAFSLRDQGWSQARIGAELGVHQTRIGQILRAPR